MTEHPNAARIRAGYTAFARGDLASLDDLFAEDLVWHDNLQTVLADDEHGVALVVLSASRSGRSVQVKEAHVFGMRDGKAAEFWNASADMYAYDEVIG